MSDSLRRSSSDRPPARDLGRGRALRAGVRADLGTQHPSGSSRGPCATRSRPSPVKHGPHVSSLFGALRVKHLDVPRPTPSEWHRAQGEVTDACTPSAAAERRSGPALPLDEQSTVRPAAARFLLPAFTCVRQPTRTGADPLGCVGVSALPRATRRCRADPNLARVTPGPNATALLNSSEIPEREH
jgi:hypothetical protein